MNYLWLLVPLILAAWGGVVLYKTTTPSFLVELAATIANAVIPVLFKVSPHSKEYWDLQHQLIYGALNKEERAQVEWQLKELIKKEAHK